MNWQFVPASLWYILAAVMTFTLAFITWRTKPEHGRIWLMVMLCAAFWAAATALETFVADLDTKLKLITTLPYLGITGLVFFWSLFTISYSHHEHWLNKYTITLLSIMPITTYLMVLTGRSHHLFWQSYTLLEKNGLFYFDGKFGPWFWIWAVYAYLVILGGSVLVITAVFRSPRLYQGQAIMLILGGLIPLFSNFLFITGLNPLAPLDISPIALSVSGIFFTVGLLRFRLFTIVPIAHDLVFRSVNSGVIIIDLQGQVVDMNPAAEQILRRHRNDIVGQNIWLAFPDYADFIRRFQNTWEVKTEITLPPDERVYELQLMPLNNRAGKTAGRIVLLYDITERKQAMAEREGLIRELDAYAHMVAHDLKSPMTIITGHTQLMLEREDALSQRAYTSLEAITRTGQKMADIIDSLLLLASVRSMEGMEMGTLDTAVIIQNAWDRVAETDTAELILPEDWPAALGYVPWVEQVWVNYLSNAIKYGGQPPRVVVGAEVISGKGSGREATVRFWVQDNGTGLTADEISLLFQQFTRLHQHRHVQGHGLGLSLVERIVEKLGGIVGVESEPGVGSIFYFTLPLAKTAVSPAPLTSKAADI